MKIDYKKLTGCFHGLQVMVGKHNPTRQVEQRNIEFSQKDEVRQMYLWQTETELGDGGNPFKWRRYHAHKHKIKLQSKGLVFATYNCWRNSANMKNRCEHLKQILLRSPADVIGLQETSPFIIRELIATPGIMNKFIFSDISGYSNKDKDGLLTLYHRHYIKVYQAFNIPLFAPDHHLTIQCSIISFQQPGPQNVVIASILQSFLLINIHVAFGELDVVLVKLEELIGRLKWDAGIIMMGDMIRFDEGIESSESETEKETELFAQYGWQDAAAECDMRSLSTSSGMDPTVSHRPDRVLYRNLPSNFGSFVPIAVNVFGSETIRSRRNNIANTYASTHLGVAAHFSNTGIAHTT